MHFHKLIDYNPSVKHVAPNAAGRSDSMARQMDPLLTVREYSEYMNQSPHTTRSHIAKRLIPFVRLGRSIRIRQSVADRRIEEGSVPARRDAGR